MTKATFEIEVESPYGKQPIESFRHFMSKVSDDALTRWGIEISITRMDNDEEVSTEDFE